MVHKVFKVYKVTGVLRTVSIDSFAVVNNTPRKGATTL